MQGHMGAALGNRVNSQRLWEAGFVELRGCGISWFPQKDVIGLFEEFCRLAGKGHLLLRDKQELYLSPLIRRVRGSYPQEQSGEGSLQLGF